ncbi:MAG: RNA-protein complex protein Nop10 [Candidatus Ranarchaeia archaeon]
MPKLLYRCSNCWRYTLHQDTCPVCGGKVVYAHPAKYSPEDRYGKYRRKLKREQSHS